MKKSNLFLMLLAAISGIGLVHACTSDDECTDPQMPYCLKNLCQAYHCEIDADCSLLENRGKPYCEDGKCFVKAVPVGVKRLPFYPPPYPW